MWRQGKLLELLIEGQQIQSRLKSKLEHDEEHGRLILEGNVRSAMKWLTTKISNGAPVDINNETLNQLTAKHPPGQPKNEDFILQGPLEQSNFIRFEELDEDSIYLQV